MSNKDRKPKYSLNGLLTLRRGDLDLAKAEIAKARDVLDRAAEATREVGQTISALEQELRGVCSQGLTIDPDRHTSLVQFLGDRREMMKLLTKELKRAESEYEQSRNRLHKVKQGVRVLEKHKEHKEQEFRVEADRKAQNQLDDMWLQQPRKSGI